jgi:hypothetical protein
MEKLEAAILKVMTVAELQSLSSRLANGTRQRGALECPLRVILSLAPLF